MEGYLRSAGLASARKLRLWACAQRRQVGALHGFDDNSGLAGLGERCADGAATEEQLRAALRAQAEANWPADVPFPRPIEYDVLTFDHELSLLATLSTTKAYAAKLVGRGRGGIGEAAEQAARQAARSPT